jgi:hypothetical protein
MAFESFEDKLRKDNRGNLTDRYEKPEYFVSQFAVRPEQKSKIDFNAWMQPNLAQTATSRLSNFDFNRQPLTSTMNPNYPQTAESKPTYSPVRRDISPTGSNVWLNTSQVSQLSKSRTKHQRKKSERPLYDASKLTIKQTA